MKQLCIYCGSGSGRSPRYREAARELGHEIAARGLGLVYGGAGVGVMGAVADAVLERGGEVSSPGRWLRRKSRTRD
jgi:predicted Rossmann-fold nucleotide-binding protein